MKTKLPFYFQDIFASLTSGMHTLHFKNLNNKKKNAKPDQFFRVLMFYPVVICSQFGFFVGLLLEFYIANQLVMKKTYMYAVNKSDDVTNLNRTVVPHGRFWPARVLMGLCILLKDQSEQT